MSTVSNAGRIINSFHNTSIASSAHWVLTGSAITLAALVAYLYSQGKLFQTDDSKKPSFTASGYNEMSISPDVKERMKKVYMYVFGGLAITAAAATLAHVSGLSSVIFQSKLAWAGIVVGSIGSLIGTMFSKANSMQQKTIWAVFTATMGLSMAPLGYLDKVLLAQAAVITLGLGSVLSYIAYNAPDKRYSKYEGTLMGGLTAICIASFVAVFFPKTAFAYGVDRLSLYAGFAIFCGLFLASSQNILTKSQESAENSQSLKKFNAINLSLGLYLDTLNLFVRIVRMMNESKNRESNRDLQLV